MADSNIGEEDEDLAAARWVMAIDAGLEPQRVEAFHAWLAARPERAELIARQAELQELAGRAGRQIQAGRSASQNRARRPNTPAPVARRSLVFGGAMAAAAAIAGVGWVTRERWLGVGEAPEEVFETATGEVRAIQLADGSRLWLDARSRISVRLAQARRDVALPGGRLFVEVAHDAKRPFVLHGANFEARDIGTSFEATVFEDRSGVAVAEGVVRLTPQAGGPAIDLAAGQGAWISRSGEVTRIAARGVGAWRQRRMVLADRRLDAALAELSRYFDRPLVVTDGELAARRISLSFSIADLKAEDAASNIANAVGAEVADQGGAGLLLRPAQPRPR